MSQTKTFPRITVKQNTFDNGERLLLIQVSPRKFIVKKEGKPISEIDKFDNKTITFVETLRYISDLNRAQAEEKYNQLLSQ